MLIFLSSFSIGVIVVSLGLPPLLEAILWLGGWCFWTTILLRNDERNRLDLAGEITRVASLAGCGWGLPVGLFRDATQRHNQAWYGDLGLDLSPLAWLFSAIQMGIATAVVTGWPFILYVLLRHFRGYPA